MSNHRINKYLLYQSPRIIRCLMHRCHSWSCNYSDIWFRAYFRVYTFRDVSTPESPWNFRLPRLWQWVKRKKNSNKSDDIYRLANNWLMIHIIHLRRLKRVSIEWEYILYEESALRNTSALIYFLVPPGLNRKFSIRVVFCGGGGEE